MSEQHVTLYGDAAEQFTRIQRRLEERRGHEMSNAAVVRQLMAWHEMSNRFE